MGVVVISTVVFILSTMPELTDDIDIILFNNETKTEAEVVKHQNQEGSDTVERWEQVEKWLN